MSLISIVEGFISKYKHIYSIYKKPLVREVLEYNIILF
jgi:hypothetical protein